MTITKNWLDNLVGLTLAVLCILALAQCGSGSDQKTLVFTTTPNPAIVIESDYARSYTTSTGTVVETRKGPWTIWKASVTNVTTSTITIFNLHFESVGMNSTFKGDFGGKDLDTPKETLFTISPGETIPFSVKIYALPSREQVHSLNYFFRGKAIGWYGDEPPTKSFKSSFTFRASE